MSGRNSGAIAVVQVHDYAHFMGLRDAWNALAMERSVFLRHEWSDAVWQWRKQDAATRLHILCVYRGTHLIGVCPMIAHLERAGAMSRRTLEFLSVPDNQACDMIAAASEENVVSEALAVELTESHREWDVLRLSYLPEHSLALKELARALRDRGIAQHTNSLGGNPYVALETSWDDYYSTRSRRLKKANNLTANRLKKAGDVCIEWLEPKDGSAANASSALETAIAISAASWKRSTGNSLDSPGPQAFFRRISEHALAQGWLSLWLLSLDGKPIAMEYQLVFNGKVHALRADVVEGLDDISPGSHLNRHLLEQLFGRGLQRYLMGPGDNPYKKHWTEVSEPLYRLDAYSPSARGRLAALWYLNVKPTLRALRAKLKPSKKEKTQ